jgi:hypothetical protein
MGVVVVMAVAVEVEHPSPVSVPAAADGLNLQFAGSPRTVTAAAGGPARPDRPAGHGKVDPRPRAARVWEAYAVHFCVGPPFKAVASLLLSCVKRYEKKSR